MAPVEVTIFAFRYRDPVRENLKAAREGGMAEVYLALDTKLGRKVAIKILPAELASNQDRMRRFTQEAKAAAALNHPNIAHICEIGEHDGTSFIAMEYVDGHTVRQLIHDRQTSFAKLLRWLLAEGLAKAHAAGVVHRDLKPDNIMISRDGYTKISDFSLAKLVEPQKTSHSNTNSSELATALLQQHSTPGMVMGTVGHMSPEQALGKVREIDARSDIFSFGCNLSEAATRQKAFEGKDVLDSLHKIVHARQDERDLDFRSFGQDTEAQHARSAFRFPCEPRPRRHRRVYQTVHVTGEHGERFFFPFRLPGDEASCHIRAIYQTPLSV